MLKKTFFTFIIFTLLAVNFAWVGIAKADPAPYFSLISTQGQGDDDNEFYVGRCFRVNIYLNTGGYNTNGADVEINYDNSVLQVVQSNCSTSATTVYSDGLFDVYPGAGNSISSSKILLSAYNNPGNSTNVSNGLYGHLFFKVLSVDADYDLDFEYTQDLTTDTNLAETGGDGSDILQSVENINLSLLEDSDNPVIDTQSPSSGATGVAVNSTISFRLYDAMAGIDNSSVTSRMKEGDGTYYSQSVSVGSQQSTNQTRYYQYTGSYNPNSNIKTNGGYYEYATTYTVEVTTDDLGSASTHSTTSVWTFTTEDDTNAPYTSNFSPTDGSSGVAVDTNISFRVKDYKSNGGVIPGLGVDEDTIVIVVSSDSLGELNYTCSSDEISCNVSNPNNVLVTIDSAEDFSENETVTVQIGASDLHSPANVMSTSTYSFTTEDTAPPTVSDFTPTPNSSGNASSTNISFHLLDGGSGVAIESLGVYVDNDYFTAISDEVTITGDASDYLIEIDPVDNFTEDQAVVVRISARDQASTPNYISPNPSLYSFIVGLEGSTVTVTTTVTTTEYIETTCPTCPTCTGGGGGGVIYIEKECPEVQCPEVQTCEEQIICPIVEEPSCPDTGNNPNGSNTVVEEVNQGGGGSIVTSSPSDEDVGTALAFRLLPTKIDLEKINEKKLSASKYLRIADTEKMVKLEGSTDASEGTVLPILFYPKSSKLTSVASQVDLLHFKDPITGSIVVNTKVDAQGRFLLELQNIFTPGSYIVRSLAQDKDSKEQEVEIGSFDIDETYFIPLRTEEEQSKIDRRYNWAGIIVFASIVLVSIMVLFATRSMVGGMGFATTFVLAIFGMVVIVMQTNNRAIIVEKLKTGIESNVGQDSLQKYQEIIEDNRQNFEVFNGQLLDPINNQPISGASVEVGEQVSVSDDFGQFSLQDIFSTDRVKISRSDFSQPVYLIISEIIDNKIGLNSRLLETLSKIEKDQNQRRFKLVYNYSAGDVQSQIGQDLFVQSQNKALLGRIQQLSIVDSGFYPQVEVLDSWESTNLNQTYNNVAKVDYVYSGYNEKQGVVKLREPWYFVEEGGEWRFLE